MTCQTCGAQIPDPTSHQTICTECRKEQLQTSLYRAQVFNLSGELHGSRGYRNGCRCDVCREAVAAYRRKHRAKLRAEGRGEVAYDKTCLVCGASYVARKRHSRYCSDRCKAWGRRGYTMSPSRELIVWSPPRRRVRPRKPKERKQRFFGGVCLECGVFFWSEWRTSDWCSGKCRETNRARRRNRYHREVDQAARLYILNRDQWVCQLCFGDIDPTLPSNHRWSATLDHIVPQSKGGSDKPLNLRAAHMYCNAVRGDRVGDFAPMLLDNIL